MLYKNLASEPPDAVFISHNHYDHLEMPTLQRLPASTRLLVPAGLRAFFVQRGFPRTEEFGWWETTIVGPLRATFVPTQHWSRRTPWDAGVRALSMAMGMLTQGMLYT